MSVSPFDSAITRKLLSDTELAALFSDAAEIRALLDVEAALARAQGGLVIIPREAAAKIDAAARQLTIAPASLEAATAQSGVPITGLLAQLRKVAGDGAPYVHWGATSQDIIDTALILRLKTACGLLAARLARLASVLAAQADAHRRTVMAGRTRFQQAVPISYGLKVAGWLAMLCRHRDRLRELQPRLLMVQFGGAAGTLAALGSRGMEVTDALARELGLSAPVSPWHSQRDTLAEFAGWLSLVSGSLGKIGRDVLLLAQSEVAEVRPAAAGGSSAMPQKANPVAAEMLVALADFNAHAVGAMHGAMGQEHERSGIGWTVEWLTLPQMLIATGAALGHAEGLVGGLTVDGARMRAGVEASRGLILAEAAVYALAAHMPRPDAEALVESACKTVLVGERHLCDVLAGLTKAPVDFARLRDPIHYLGSADKLIDRILAEAKAAFQNERAKG